MLKSIVREKHFSNEGKVSYLTVSYIDRKGKEMKAKLPAENFYFLLGGEFIKYK